MAQILKFYGRNRKIWGQCNNVPLEWFRPSQPTYSNKLLRVIENKDAHKALQQKTYDTTATTLLLLFQGTWQVLKNGADYNQNMILSWVLIILLASLLFDQHVCSHKSAAIAELVNGFIQFEKMYPKRTRNFLDLPVLQRCGNILPNVYFFSQVAWPVGVIFGLHLTDPWKPSLAGYWIIPKVELEPGQNILFGYLAIAIKVILLGYNYWLWNYLTPAALFLIGMVYNLCTISLLECIEL